MKTTTPGTVRRRPTPHVRHPGGFTLVEVMVVVFIIAILTAITVRMIPAIRIKVAGTQTQSQMSKIAMAIQAYYGDFHAYPGPLANNQLGSAYDADATAVSQAYVINPADGTQVLLKGTNGQSATAAAAGTTYPLSAVTLTGAALGHITGSENLFLALCGGLRVTVDTNNQAKFEYHPEDVFPDGRTPAPRGPQSLTTNTALARQTKSYIDLGTTDVSIPQGDGMSGLVNGGSFTMEGGRHSSDSLIPEFLDKYADPMPLIYYRTNVGGKAICGVRDANGTKFLTAVGGTPITNPNPTGYGNSGNPIAQYDLLGSMDYTIAPSGMSAIGTVANKSNLTHHGLQAAGANDLSDTVASGWANNGANGIAYLKDPNYSAVIAAQNAANPTTPPSNASGAVARNADGFLLISAGPDRIYGTADDILYPGGSVAGQ